MNEPKTVVPAPWNPDANVSHNDIEKFGDARRVTRNLSPHTADLEVQNSRYPRPDDEVSVQTRRNRGYSTAAKKLQQENSQDNMSLKSLKDSFDLNGIGSAFKAAGQQTNSELTVIDMMAQDIHKSRVYYSGNMDAPYWLPVNDLYRIVNEESVYKALTHTLNPDQVDATDVRGYAARVCGLIEYVDHRDQLSSSGARSMFAILVMIDKVDEIKQYIDNGFTDEDLPLVSPPNNTGHRLCPKSFATGELECWTIGQTWKRWEWTAFQTYQRMTRSPFFELRQSKNKLPHYDLDVGTVLPFVGDFGKLETASGGFSTVRRVQIHPAHHDEDSSQGQPFFAVKELHRYREVQYGKRELDFKEEVRSWAKSAGVSKHPHLIRLLATWRQNDTWCLLFPWANSNLEGFWRSKTPGRNLRFTKWVSKQCLGLAEGLRSIHKSRSDPMRQWGIHGDIKPQNILWFNDPEDKGGKLVISDFGLTRFHGEETRSNALPPGKDPTYQAPEYGFHNGISRAADIWALGCVYLEFVTWYLIGFEGLENSIQRRIQDDRGQIESFRQDKFFNLSPTENGGHGAELKRSVTNLITDLRRNQHCTTYFNGLLDLIQNRLLCTEPKDREKCDLLVITLRELDQSLQDNYPDEDIVVDQRDHLSAAGGMLHVPSHSEESQTLPGYWYSSFHAQPSEFSTWAVSSNDSSHLSDRIIRTHQLLGNVDAQFSNENSSDAKTLEQSSETIDDKEIKNSKKLMVKSEQVSLPVLFELPSQSSCMTTAISSNHGMKCSHGNTDYDGSTVISDNCECSHFDHKTFLPMKEEGCRIDNTDTTSTPIDGYTRRFSICSWKNLESPWIWGSALAITLCFWHKAWSRH